MLHTTYNNIKIFILNIMSVFQFVGASCGKHGTHTFYKAFKYFNEGKFRILTLGEFFFLKISDDSPVCIGELQLLWENQSDTELLCSIRLYFLPENTPEGKQEFHGEVTNLLIHLFYSL